MTITAQQDAAAIEFLQSLESQGTPATTPRRSKATNFFEGFGEQASMGGRGGFRGGQIDRINEEWRPGSTGPNRMIQANGQLLRERAWDLYINNPFAQSVIDAMLDNVVECGLSPERNEAWEREYARWGGMSVHSTKHADLSRDQTVAELQRTWLREVFVGGGCLMHFVTVDRRTQRVPLAIELLGEDRFADHIMSFGRNPKTAYPVYNAIELDPASGRTRAYHVRKHAQNDMNLDPDEVLRIPVDRCRYGYFKWRTSAKRGTTKLRTVLNWLWSIGYYADNELINSDIKSSWAYMIKTSGDTDLDWADLETTGGASQTDAYGNKLETLQRNSIFRGYPGDEIQAIGPNVPPGDSAIWVQLMLRIIAVGTGCSYEEAYRDYSKGSWSAIRAAMASDRKRWRCLQTFLLHNFANPLVSRFDAAAVSNFVAGFPSPSAWLSEQDEAWESHEWSPPGWESPNPKDDAAADDIRLKNGTATHQSIQGRMGKSWKKQFSQRELEASTPGYPKQITAGGVAFDDSAATETGATDGE